MKHTKRKFNLINVNIEVFDVDIIKELSNAIITCDAEIYFNYREELSHEETSYSSYYDEIIYNSDYFEKNEPDFCERCQEQPCRCSDPY